MGRIGTWPQDDAADHGALPTVNAVTLHRTYGEWPGDYGVIKSQGLAHFLIGQEEGQRVQFADTSRVQWHCNGSNFKSIGVELTGTNDDPLTDWQVRSLSEVLRFAQAAHGVPIDAFVNPFTTPPASIWVNGGGFFGVICHVSVKTDDGSSQHTNLVTPGDYAKAVLVGTPAPTPEKDDEPMLYVFNPHNPTEIWCFAGNTRRHVSPDEWAFVQFVGGSAIRPSVDWFDSYPVAA